MSRFLCFATSLVFIGIGDLHAETEGGVKFLTDPIEVFDKDEELIGEYPLDTLAVKSLTVRDKGGDMVLLINTDGSEFGRVFKTDVKSSPGCRVSVSPQPQKSQSATTMGMDNGSLCE